MTNKRYYWIKLKQDFYDNNEAIDFLMAQPNGSDYVVLYQMLCLKTVNNNGGLFLQAGEVIIPYDVDKIVRLCKYFKRDTVKQALNFYKHLGLIYKEESGKVFISDFNELVGSESESASRVRKHRHKKDGLETVAAPLQCNKAPLQCDASVTQEPLQCNAKTPLQCNVEKDIYTDIDIYTERDTKHTVCVPTRAQEFCNKYGVKIDTQGHTHDDDIAKINFDVLDKAYAHSTKFLQRCKSALRLSWIIRSYDTIVSGTYDDFNQNDKNFTPDYSADKLNAAFEKLNEEL